MQHDIFKEQRFPIRNKKSRCKFWTKVKKLQIVKKPLWSQRVDRVLVIRVLGHPLWCWARGSIARGGDVSPNPPLRLYISVHMAKIPEAQGLSEGNRKLCAAAGLNAGGWKWWWQMESLFRVNRMTQVSCSFRRVESENIRGGRTVMILWWFCQLRVQRR